MKKQQLLLLKDVYGLGRKGQVVYAKPGYFRNFLLPGKKAVRAHKHTLRMQERLQQEREEKAKIDREESHKLREKLTAITLKITVKTDPEGRLYGSVTAADVLQLLTAQGITLTKHAVKLGKPIKKIGTHVIALQLQEEVSACVKLVVDSENVPIQEAPAEQKPDAGSDAAQNKE